MDLNPEDRYDSFDQALNVNHHLIFVYNISLYHAYSCIYCIQPHKHIFSYKHTLDTINELLISTCNMNF